MALRAAEDDEDALVARAFSRPSRHLGVEVGLDAARVGACATKDDARFLAVAARLGRASKVHLLDQGVEVRFQRGLLLA
jgi:hypothetical protein